MLPWADSQKPLLQQLLSEMWSPSRRWPAGGTSGVLGPVGDFLSPPPLHGTLVQCKNPPTSSAAVSTIYISSAVLYTSLLMTWTFPMEVLLFIDLLFAHSRFTELWRQALGLPGAGGESPSILQLMETLKALGNLGKK